MVQIDREALIENLGLSHMNDFQPGFSRRWTANDGELRVEAVINWTTENDFYATVRELFRNEPEILMSIEGSYDLRSDTFRVTIEDSQMGHLASENPETSARYFAEQVRQIETRNSGQVS
jgi:hypothetical protein